MTERDQGDETAIAVHSSDATSSPNRGRHLGDLLLHPVALGALAMLVFNDHVAKDRWPSDVTGKVSDVAGLVFFPLLLVSIAEAARWLVHRDRWVLGPRALVVAIVITAVGFAAIKTWGPAGDAYRIGNGVARWPLDAVPSLMRGEGLTPVGTVRLVEDRTDLFALVALVVPWWIGSRILRLSPGR
jgi:hypothetical protein